MIRSCSDVTLSLLDINCLIYSFSDGITILYCQALFTNFEFTHKWRDVNHSSKNIVTLSEKRIITQLISKVESVTSEQELINEY